MKNIKHPTRGKVSITPVTAAPPVVFHKPGNPSADILWRESQCNGCGLCAEACTQAAVVIEKSLEPVRISHYPCAEACPAGIDVARYVRAVATGQFDEAVAVIREKIPFPAVCGYVCQAPCETVCRRSLLDEPILIRELKRAAAEYGGDAWRQGLETPVPTGRRAAVIGSGPAGLTAAYFLARRGHEVTVFEALDEPGGKMRHSIRDWHLPKDILKGEIDIIREAGVRIETGCRIGSPDLLFDDGFGAVLLAAGLHRKPAMPPVDSGADLNGREFLASDRARKLVSPGSRVVILGGGRVAFDCALKARSAGAGEIHMVSLEYRCGGESDVTQSEQAFDAGTTVHSWRVFPRVIHREGQVVGVEYYKMRAFGFLQDGGLEIEPVPGSERFIEADLVVDALGIRFHADCVYRRPGFFAAGDAVSELRSVIEAVAAGRWAAGAMDRYLGGTGDIDEKLTQDEPAVLPVVHPSRAGPAEIITDMMPGGYAQVELTLSRYAAREEARRCLSCDIVYPVSRFSVDMSLCTGCGQCVVACGRNALALGDSRT
ncbi:FAD dependent oxidoreductase [Dehalogenimonas lykanthroporepellens BL-DC-9]|nr:FAD dependent oxidoreductase [Dehalogenimonas lykanthroporepellens BL-DC-9]